MLWSATEAFSRQGLQFVITLVLARLISPEEFGLIAMLGLFIGVAGVFADSGFGSALIQKENLSIKETSSVFFFNLALGAIGTGVLCLIAPWIAGFYRMPILCPLTRWMAPNLFLSSLGAVHTSLMSRELDFRTQTRITLLATVLSGAVAISMAFGGWGAWSLVGQGLVATSCRVTLLWWWRPWRPCFAFEFRALGSLFGFGFYLMFASLLDVVFARAQSLLIGRWYSARDLGFYTRADTTQQFPAALLSSVVDRVAFPLFSATKQDPQLLARGMQTAVTRLMLINVPVMLGMVAVADPLVHLLFGQRWAPCVPYLQVLCFGGILWPLHILNLTVLKALGRSDLFLRLELIKKILGIAVLVAAAPFGILAMAWATVVLGAACYFLNAHYTGVFLGYSPFRQLRDISPAAGIALAMVALVHYLGLLGARCHEWVLAFQVLLGALIYVLLAWMFKVPGFHETVREIKHRFTPSVVATP